MIFRQFTLCFTWGKIYVAASQLERLLHAGVTFYKAEAFIEAVSVAAFVVAGQVH